jgi:hypothetical protein
MFRFGLTDLTFLDTTQSRTSTRVNDAIEESTTRADSTAKNKHYSPNFLSRRLRNRARRARQLGH